jgi:putative transposase
MDAVDGPGTARERKRSIRRPPPPWVTFEATFFVTMATQIRRADLLCVSGIAPKLRTSIDAYDARGAWRTIAAVVMPDHVHLLVTVPDGRRLLPLVTAWKRYTARQYEVRWKLGFFERRLRKHDSVAAKIEYIRQNPVRAGLVRRPEDWPHLWIR